MRVLRLAFIAATVSVALTCTIVCISVAVFYIQQTSGLARAPRQEQYFHLLDAYWLSDGGRLPVEYRNDPLWDLIERAFVGQRPPRQPPLLGIFARAAALRENSNPGRQFWWSARGLATSVWITRNADRAYFEGLILSETNHGLGAIGARTAALRLFGVPVEELALDELALLAALATQPRFNTCDDNPNGYFHAVLTIEQLQQRIIACEQN